MIGKVSCVVFDCPDTRALASFYQQLTGWEILDEEDEWVTLGGDGEVKIAFQHAPDHRAPTWPEGAVPQQAHLDIAVEDFDEAEQQALAIGAKLLEGSEHHPGFRVYADPAGHPFCFVME